MSTASEIPSYHSRAASLSTSQWQQNDGLTSTSTSEMPSPSMRGLDSVVLSSPSETYDPHYRGPSTISSSSSTMTLKRSYLKSSASQLSILSNSSRRESYLPHSPLNRDSIQIIPPQPLGFGGNMAMATDQRTLAFSTNSGIGASEDFTSGLVWTEPSDQASRSRNARRPHLGNQERHRYLMEGPVSTRTSEAPSLIPSSQSSPVAQTASLHRSPEAELPFPTSASPDLRHANPHDGSRLQPKASLINPQLLGAKDSPLQRLQSNAGQAQPPPRPRAPSDDNSHRSDSDASPILSPFVHRLSPPSTSDGVASNSSQASGADAGGPAK